MAVEHEVPEGEVEHLPAPLAQLGLLVVGVEAGLAHHVAPLVVHRGLGVRQAQERVDPANLQETGDRRQEASGRENEAGGRGRSMRSKPGL